MLQYNHPAPDFALPTFIVDRDGVLRWGQAGDRNMVRDGREIVRVLGLIRTLRGKS
jgi:alkyl hydroperoxide reductase subunit AhpC